MTEHVLTASNLGKLQVERVSEVDPYINLLVYGESGIGKTRFAGSASVVEAMSPVLLVDIEGGSMTLRDTYPQVERVRVKSWEEMQALYDTLFAKNPYKTIIMDSLTEIQKFSMYQIMIDLVKKGRNSGEPVDPDVPGMREWGKNGEQIRKLVRAFRDLPCNTIFTALVNADKNPRSGKVVHRPSLPGKLQHEIAAFVDIVVYLYKKEVEEAGETNQVWRLLTQSTEEYIAKDRTNKLPLVVEAPTMQRVHDIIFPQGQKASASVEETAEILTSGEGSGFDSLVDPEV